jgi:2-polyprenyl-6-methoxyphenol hydroxylase-like FAD-dependent oxidoreductase
MKESSGVGERASAPEIDREKLVGMLLDAVGKDNVRWGKHLKRVDAEKGTLEFADGSTEGPFDLVVGADGAWSKVRQALTDERPRYSGISGIEAHIDQPEKYPQIGDFVGRGSYFAFSGGRSLMAQRQGDNSIKLSTYMKRDEAFIDELSPGDHMDQDDLRPKLLSEYKDWAPELREWIAVAHLKRKWKLWELPVGTTWEHRPGYTLVGDSAHLCTPFAGLGVNAAMQDSLELAELLIKAIQDGEPVDSGVQAYEKAMFPRAKKVQLDTMRNKTNGFANDAPVNFISAFIGVVGEETGWPIDKGILYFVPITRTVYAIFWTQTRLYPWWKWVKSFFKRKH